MNEFINKMVDQLKSENPSMDFFTALDKAREIAAQLDDDEKKRIISIA